MENEIETPNTTPNTIDTTLDLYVVSTRYSDLDAGTLGIRLGLGNISYTGGNLRNETFQGHLLEQ